MLAAAHLACCVGIDVRRDWLDGAGRPSGDAWRVANDAAGIDALVVRRRTVAPAGNVLEASGGLAAAVAAALGEDGRPVAVGNPRHARACAKATGQRAKTDARDAGMLARFAEAIRPPVRPSPDADQRRLAGLMARRRQRVDLLVAERQRLARARPTV